MKNVIGLLAKILVIPLGLTEVVLATDAAFKVKSTALRSQH